MSNAHQLAAILKKSKAILQETEENFGRTGNSKGGGGMETPTQSHGEKEMPNLTEKFIKENSGTPKSVAPVNGEYRNLSTTKLPKEIVDAMVNNPIDIPESPFDVDSFDHKAVAQLMEDTPSKEVPQKIEETKQRKSNTSKTVSSDTIRKIVKEEMENVVRSVIEEYFDTSLMTEDIQIKVGDTVFSGNLKPLPKNSRKKTVKRKKRV